MAHLVNMQAAQIGYTKPAAGCAGSHLHGAPMLPALPRPHLSPSCSHQPASLAQSAAVHNCMLSRRTVQAAAAPAAKGFGAKPAKLDIKETCPCGSRQVYRECCEKYHEGKDKPATAELQLRARFSAFVKGKEEYIVSTFHPGYLPFKYPDYEGDALDQLKRDVRMACTSYDFSKLKVLSVKPGSNPDEAYIEFQYASKQRAVEKRGNNKNARQKAAPVDRNADGSVKISDTVERSRFVRDAESGWRFLDYELIKFPEWMAEAKEAELKSRQQAAPQAVAQE